ncbi:alpha-L-rhamnosidase [Natronospirillum operosum]|uniref:alpha-L-rhamnosidase n=1 Tax=Natronospirillum operosum TaxID=2759953 RepID=A0A4Z0WE31_9GAMM|nr:alpha-L-rhamnosidase [Natronospirillum operosum]TGG93502.1 alpha-L-rhamnosidase [Natronospirillum operosum]
MMNTLPSINWTALMIGPETDSGVGAPAPALAREFSLSGGLPAEATLYITAWGLYCCFINGRRVGEDILTPGWTPYDLRLAYQTYDVSALLQEGTNHIEIWLADGWLRSQMMWKDAALTNTWGDRLGALAEIRSADDEVLLKTDASWLSGVTPIRRSGIYFGEHYDAGQKPGAFAGSVNVLPLDYSVLFAQETTPVRELEPFEAVASWEDADGRLTVDFGQNLAGYVSFTVQGDAGDEVLVEHAEILGPDGTIDNRNFRTAEAILRYQCRGGEPETYRPWFTFMGYRYVRVTLSGRARLQAIQSIPISSVREQTGHFECGHPLVNQLVSNTLWSQRSNFIEAPTDCPQRDERLGWTGDAQVFAGTACYLHNSHAFLRSWMRDVIAEQTDEGAIPHVVPNPVRRDGSRMPNMVGSTGWGDVIHVMPWTLWLHYADRAALEEAYPAMQRWIDFVWSISEGPIVRPPREWSERGFSFGDWLQPSGSTEKPNATIGDDAAATIYLYIALTNTTRIAEVLDRQADASALKSRADDVRQAFAREFITASGRIGYNDQTSYALAILHDLVPPELRAAARHYFVESIRRTGKTIGTGFIGTPALLPALIKAGEPELAAELFLQESVPGWLYQVRKGATTIWERWDAIREDDSIFEPDMNSYNHYAYGAVCQWLFESVAGICPDADQPGFRVINMQPVILPELGPVKASHRCHLGQISASWNVAGDRVTYEVDIPASAEGCFSLAESATDIRLNGQPTSLSEVLSLPSGAHQIEFRLPRLNRAMQAHQTAKQS